MGTTSAEKSVVGELRELPFTRKDAIGWLLILPGLLLFLLFMIYPIAYLIYLSFTDATTASSVVRGDLSFVGFQNYTELLTDSNFRNSMFVTWLFLAVSLAIKLVVAIGIALVLTHARVKGKRYMRAIVIIPMGFPPIFTISVWRGMFSGVRFSPFNIMLDRYNDVITFINGPSFMLVDLPVAFLATRWTAFAAYVTTEVWLAYPFMVIIIVSALQDVPMELHDAAKVDGAGFFHRFIHVTAPAIKGPVLFASILTAATSFQNFLIPWVFNRGGPSRSNELILVYGYREAIALDNFAFASAIMVVAIMIIGMFMWIAVKKTNLADGVN